MEPLRLALSFLTVLPLAGSPAARGVPPLASAAVWFPLAGALVGAVSAVTFLVLARAFPPGVAALGAALAAYAVTGCMHLDGLADTADGLAAAGRDGGRQAALAAMRDPRLGAQGVLAVLAAVLARTMLAAGLGAAAAPVLLVAPVLGRWGMVLLMPVHRYAREGPGLGGHFAGLVGWPAVAGATLLALALVWAALLVGGSLGVGPEVGLAGPAGAAVAAGALAGAAGLAALATGLAVARRLGGVTGDVFGAANEVAEVAVLAAAMVLA